MRLTGWRYAAFIGTFVAAIGVNCYFTIISPLINSDQYKQIQEQAQAEIAEKERTVSS